MEKTVFDVGIVRWKVKEAHVAPEDKPTTLQHTLCCTNKELYHKVTAILTILVTMPVSTATPERSFSTMRRVKTHMPSTREPVWCRSPARLQRQDHRHRQSRPGVLCQEAASIGIRMLNIYN